MIFDIILNRCSGFSGGNEIALDMFTRVAVDHMRNLGRTLRLLVDGFSHKMTPEVYLTLTADHGLTRSQIQELILHALHENGQVQPADLEGHIKDDIEREGGKISEMTRKIRQAYKEVVSSLQNFSQD